MSERPSRIEIPPEIEAEMTPAVKRFVDSLIDQIQTLTDQNRALSVQVEQLSEKVEKLTPRNSSLPPGSEHPHAKPKPKRKPGKKRKQGGQKGHKRHLRELIPSDDCDQVVPCKPTGCRRCGGELQEDPSEPQRHQVWELPQISPSSMNTSCIVGIALAVGSPPPRSFRKGSRAGNVVPGWRPSPGC